MIKRKMIAERCFSKRRKIFSLTFIVILILSILLIDLSLQTSNTTAGPSTIEFTPNVRVNDILGTTSAPPSIAVGNNNYIYVVWEDDRNDKDDIYFAKSTDDGLTFSTSMRVNDDIINATNRRAKVAVDKDDYIYVVWQDNRNGDNDWDIYFSRSTDGGLSFSNNTRVNDGPPGTWDCAPSMAVDENGNIYIAWTDWRNADYDIYFTKSIDKGLSFSPNVKVNDDNDTGQGTPSIAVDNDGNIFVAWVDFRNGGFDRDIYFARSIDNGKTFETNIRVNDDSSGDTQWNPSITVDNEKNIYVAWGDSRESGKRNIYFAKSTDMGLSFDANMKINDEEPQPTMRSDNPSIAANEKNDICVVWRDGRNDTSNYNIYFARSTDGGLSFNKNTIVNDDIGDTWQSLPSITVDSFGFPYVVWRDERNGDPDIYFARAIRPTFDLGIKEKDIEFDPPSPVRINSTITINATIHNIGQVNISDVMVKFYDSDPSLNNQIGTDQIIFSIEGSGGIGFAEVEWIPMTKGYHDIYIVIDPNNTIFEWNETNNIALKVLKVKGILPPMISIRSFGDDIILNWTPPKITDLSYYLIYRSNSQTEFDFSDEWVNTSQHDDNGIIPLRTTWNDTGAADPCDQENYSQQWYYCIRAVNNLGEMSHTSITVGKWTKTFQRGVSTFSLPLEPLNNITVDWLTSSMNAEYIKFINHSSRKWLQHNLNDCDINNTKMKLGEAYEVKFSNQTNYTFTGKPGAMIIYNDDCGFSGFNPAFEAKNLSVSVEQNGDVNLIWQEPDSMGVGDWYEVYYSTIRDGFFGTLGIDYFLLYPNIYFGNNTATHVSVEANNPGTYLYYMVVPYNVSGLQGSSTFSKGIWTEEYIFGYDTFGIPLKLDNDQTAHWYCKNIPDSVGINYYITNQQRWGWHSKLMPEGVFNPVLEMSKGYQISTSNITKFTFIGM